MAKHAKPEQIQTRDPDRTRERILASALHEFAAKGFAGARVDNIARRASINKRMLYHYFGNKEKLFRAVLRQKIAERRAWAENLPSDPTERLPFWFKAACENSDWVRLLEWESLQTEGRKVIDEDERLEQAVDWLRRLRQRQQQGALSLDFDVRHIALAMQSLTMFPQAFPQLSRLIAGRPVADAKFQSEYGAFLRKFAEAFRPMNARTVKINFSK